MCKKCSVQIRSTGSDVTVALIHVSYRILNAIICFTKPSGTRDSFSKPICSDQKSCLESKIEREDCFHYFNVW